MSKPSNGNASSGPPPNPTGKPPPPAPAPSSSRPSSRPPPPPQQAGSSGRTSPALSEDAGRTHNNTLHVPNIRTSDEFDRIVQVGEGTYGSVYKAKDRLTNELVAMKKIRMTNEKEGFPITAIREIKLLRDMDHENVVKLKEVVSTKETRENRGKGSVYIVFEFMEHDLMGLMDTANMEFSTEQIKCFSKQLLAGLHYCHKRGIMHRDIKGSNLLISNEGVLKLGDFGLSRTFNEKDQQYRYTNRVVTLWYRPPELLLGAVVYGPAIDMWGVGCIIAELLMRRPLFPGKNEKDQMEKVFELCGTPNENVWPGCSQLPYYNAVQKSDKECLPDRLKHKLEKCDMGQGKEKAVDLLRKLLTMDPAKRMGAQAALDHDWFWTDPMPCHPSKLPRYPSSHEFVTKKRRADNKGMGQPDPKRHHADNHRHPPNGRPGSDGKGGKGSFGGGKGDRRPSGGKGHKGQAHDRGHVNGGWRPR